MPHPEAPEGDVDAEGDTVVYEASSAGPSLDGAAAEAEPAERGKRKQGGNKRADTRRAQALPFFNLCNFLDMIALHICSYHAPQGLLIVLLSTSPLLSAPLLSTQALLMFWLCVPMVMKEIAGFACSMSTARQGQKPRHQTRSRHLAGCRRAQGRGAGTGRRQHPGMLPHNRLPAIALHRALLRTQAAWEKRDERERIQAPQEITCRRRDWTKATCL